VDLLGAKTLFGMIQVRTHACAAHVHVRV
jgi:hypothetical protein